MLHRRIQGTSIRQDTRHQYQTQPDITILDLKKQVGEKEKGHWELQSASIYVRILCFIHRILFRRLKICQYLSISQINLTPRSSTFHFWISVGDVCLEGNQYQYLQLCWFDRYIAMMLSWNSFSTWDVTGNLITMLCLLTNTTFS